MEINGIAHTFVTVGDFARARAFYSKLLPFLGLKNVMDIPGTYYCVGGRTGFGIRQNEHHCSCGQKQLQNHCYGSSHSEPDLHFPVESLRTRHHS